MAGDHVASRVDCEMERGEDDDDFGSDDDWDEMDDDDEHFQTIVDCFFCTKTFLDIDSAVSHCCKDHGLDLSKLKGRHNMDCYSYIKLVNFIRSTRPSCEAIMTCQQPLWSDEKYLTPTNNEDPWLMFDFEDLEETPVLPGYGELPKTGYPVNAEDGRVTLSEKHFAELQKTIQKLNMEISQKDHIASQLLEEMKQMQKTLGSVVGAGDSSGGGEILNNNVAAIRLQDDEEYFNTYAHFGIHHEMLSVPSTVGHTCFSVSSAVEHLLVTRKVEWPTGLAMAALFMRSTAMSLFRSHQDEVRTLSYRDALTLNSPSLEGKTVLDLGCGTGILSMFAAKAGAAKVIGIDQSDIIYHAMDIVRENQLVNKITLVKGRLEDTELPESHVDVIVSEWMGYFLLFEAMLDSVIYARDKHLRPGGLLLPNRCTLSILGVCDPEMHKEMLGFWSDVYGFKMSSLRSDVVREPRTCVVSPTSVVTTSAQLCLLDLMTVTTECIDFETDFQITAAKDTELTALVGYFDVFFDLPNPVMFSTSPLSKSTHWKQTVFLIETPISVRQGEVLQGKLVCRRNRKEVRSLIVTIILGNTKQQYLLS